jgi:ubiquinone/menaquinone biosynthesis C-methylase UbiE
MTRRAFRAALLLLTLGVGDCFPRAEPALEPRLDRGRTPAEPMSYLGADWLTRPERIEEEQPDQMLAALHLRPGMVVADIGAGVGYHAFRISVMVGPEGRVYATDIQPEMLAMLRKSAAERGIENVVTVLSGETTTGLPKGAIDLALMVDVYHELRQPERFLDALKEALKPDGPLALVEFRGEDPNVPIKEEHKMTAAQVIRELDAAGFSLIERQEFLPWQHLLIFVRKTG